MLKARSSAIASFGMMPTLNLREFMKVIGRVEKKRIEYCRGSPCSQEEGKARVELILDTEDALRSIVLLHLKEHLFAILPCFIRNQSKSRCIMLKRCHTCCSSCFAASTRPGSTAPGPKGVLKSRRRDVTRHSPNIHLRTQRKQSLLKPDTKATQTRSHMPFAKQPPVHAKQSQQSAPFISRSLDALDSALQLVCTPI